MVIKRTTYYFFNIDIEQYNNINKLFTRLKNLEIT